VDVHVRRLRAKLGTEHEALIGTVRNVGYRFVPAKGGDEGRVPRASRPEDLDTGATEANGLAPDEPARPQPDGAPKNRAPQETKPREASAAPADRR
jgi:hypothetical protein